MSEERASDPIRWTACQAVDALKAKEVSPKELIAAAFERIEAVDGAVNALPTRCRERAETQADEAAAHWPLHGLPARMTGPSPHSAHQRPTIGLVRTMMTGGAA